MDYTINNLLNFPIKKGWYDYITSELNKKYLKQILNKIRNEDKLMIFPFPKDVFKAFQYFEPHETKLVLLGQDPYISYELLNNSTILPQAMGLSFSVPTKIKKVPPSLKNIFKEIKNSYPDFEIPNHGNIIKWAKEEKILLLNSALTVLEGKSGSHLKLWEKFTDDIIKYLSDNYNNIIFLLLGNFSKKKSSLIDDNKHHIITAVHPSPLSAYKGFFNSNIFNKIDNKLLEINKSKISW